MNCDYVFECLTRGPFPSGGREDAAIERHLHACHECRRLADALQPAVGLFHEALNDEESFGLPCYEGGIATVAPAVEEIADKKSTPARKKAATKLAPLVFAAGLMAIACWFFFADPFTGASVVDPNPMQPVQADVMMQLANLELPQGCISASVATEVKHCCTQCHNAALQDQTPAASVGQLASSCLICHSR